MNDPAPLLFEAVSHSQGGVRLRSRAGGALDGILTAYVQGIQIGSRRISEDIAVGDFIDIPVAYFPHVALPTDIRFVLGNTEVGNALTIRSSDEVMGIVGLGEVLAENVALDNGLLRGGIVNRTNGVYAPDVYVRINNHVVRSAVVEQPRARDNGGSLSLFAVPIRIGDFCGSGLEIKVYVSGIEYPVACVAYSHETLASDKEQLLFLEEKLRQLQRSSASQLETLTSAIDRRLSIQQERLDAFIEYTLSLLVGTPIPGSSNFDAAALISTVRDLGTLAARPEQYIQGATTIPSEALVPLESLGFAFGWYDIESNEHGYFRWMAQIALIRNPNPSRSVAKIELTVSQVYGAHEPMLHASLDDQALVVDVKRSAKCFLVTLSAPSAAGEVSGTSLNIESFATGCPATDSGTNDQRILAISVTRVEFHYQA